MSQMGPELRPIGRVESSLTDPATSPKQAGEGARPAWLVFEPDAAAGLEGIEPGDQVVLVTLDGTLIVDMKPVLSPDIRER